MELADVDEQLVNEATYQTSWGVDSRDQLRNYLKIRQPVGITQSILIELPEDKTTRRYYPIHSYRVT